MPPTTAPRAISLRGGHSDRVSFTIYENKFPPCTEDMPLHRWQDGLRAIMTGVERHARRTDRQARRAALTPTLDDSTSTPSAWRTHQAGREPRYCNTSSSPKAGIFVIGRCCLGNRLRFNSSRVASGRDGGSWRGRAAGLRPFSCGTIGRNNSRLRSQSGC